MSPEPDLTSEMDEAEEIVMGRAETVVTEWGVRRPDLRSGIFSTGADGNSEQMARFLAADRGTSGVAGALVRRTVTYGPWEETTDA